ncbi:hypothetical protein H6796_02305 [Candidatus Nomurabacteria bacterium]|nr:hypothetical protein [Candidatus Nomurabacteria bacterium]
MFKRFIAIIAALFVAMATITLVAPTASANTNEVKIESSATSTATSEVTSTIRAVINGATQVTWVNPNHSKKVTKKQLRKAPRIRTKCTAANRTTQSKQIFKKTRGARVVVVKKGSCLWNMGRYNKIDLGFKWTVSKGDAVLVLKGRYYRHAFDLIGGKLVKNCWNFIGKKVDRYADKVVQVRYNLDIEEDVTVEAKANATAKAVGTLNCTSGTLYGEASAASTASASATIRVKVRGKLAAVNAKKAELEAQVKIDAEAKAKADASAKINLKCNDVPPPVTYQAPTVSASAGACVKPGEKTGVVTVSGANPNTTAAGGTFTLGTQSKSAGTVNAGGTASTTFTGLGVGTYSGTFALGAPVNKSATYTVTVVECDTPPVVDRKPVVNIMGSPAHLYVNGNGYVWIEASDPDGDPVSVKVSATGGTISGLVPVNVRWDGTACPTGKTCYRAQAWAGNTPGSMSVTATVEANGLAGESDTANLPVVADEF